MPGLFRGEVANYEQTGRYKFWKLCMMIVFSLVTLWNMVFTYRWLMEIQEGNPKDHSTLAFNFMASYLSENLILPLIPLILFGTALHRVKKFANENKDETLVMNQSMFKIHIAIVTIMGLSSVIIACTFVF